jgi:hypothetical protein
MTKYRGDKVYLVGKHTPRHKMLLITPLTRGADKRGAYQPRVFRHLAEESGRFFKKSSAKNFVLGSGGRFNIPCKGRKNFLRSFFSKKRPLTS